MRKRMIKLAAATAAALLGVAGTYGLFSDTLKVKNHIALGDVNIGVKEYARKGSSEVTYQDPSLVLPGETVSKIPRITNYGMFCWVRARVGYENRGAELTGLSDEQIGGISKDWVKRGEYYYYTQPLKRKASADFFQSVSFPEEWTEAHSGQKLGVTVQAEAIQAANFEPDFSAMSPWGNQKIEKCVHEQSGTVTCRNQETKLSVEFNGKAQKLMSVPGDFFANMGTAMPGDTFSDTISLSNTAKKAVSLSFRTAVEGQNQEQTALLKGIPLTISLDGKQVYQGTLDSPGLKKEHSLGNYAPGKTGKMSFTLAIPSEWDNAYALREAEVQWIFTVRQKDAEGSEGGDGGLDGSGDAGNTGSAVVRNMGASAASPVKTGDVSGVEAAILLLLGSGGVLLALSIFKKREGGTDNEKNDA